MLAFGKTFLLIASFIHSVIHSFTQSVSPLLPSLLLPPLPLPPSLTAIVFGHSAGAELGPSSSLQ